MTKKLVIVAAIGLFLDLSAVWAQEGVGDSNLVWNATGAAALSTRSPGRLVNAARASHAGFLNAAFSRPQISEEEENPDLSTQLKIAYIETLLGQLNEFLLLFDNLIRLQGGLEPFLPVPITPNPSTSLIGSG